MTRHAKYVTKGRIVMDTGKTTSITADQMQRAWSAGAKSKEQQALERAQARQRPQLRRPGSTVSSMSVEDIVARVKAVRSLASVAVAKAALTEEEAAVLAELKATHFELIRMAGTASMDAKRYASSRGRALETSVADSYVSAAEAELADATEQARTVERHVESKFGVRIADEMIEESVNRLERRRKAEEIGENLVSVARGESITPAAISGALEQEDMKNVLKQLRAGEEGVLFSWVHLVGPDGTRKKQIEKNYGSADPDDEVITSVAMGMAEIVKSFKTEGERRHDAFRSEVEKYLVSVASVEAREGFQRSLTRFLVEGVGQVALCPLKHPKYGSFLGRVVMTRVEGRRFRVEQATDDNLQAPHWVFGYKPRDGAWVDKGSFEVTIPAHGGELVLDELERRPAIRAGILSQIDYEQSGEKRRQEMSDISDVTKIANPITWEVALGGKTAGVVPFQATVVRDGGRRFTFYLQVEFEGEGHGWVTRYPDGLDKRDTWIREYVEDMATADAKAEAEKRGKDPEKTEVRVPTVRRFRDDPNWARLARSNKVFERNWQLDREATARNAVPLGPDTADKFYSLGEGGENGLYAVRAFFQAEGMRFGSPVGFLVERKGDEITFVWGVPGASRDVPNDAGDPVIGKTMELGSLPDTVKRLLVGPFWAVKGLKDDPTGLEKIPSHLRYEGMDEDYGPKKTTTSGVTAKQPVITEEEMMSEASPGK